MTSIEPDSILKARFAEARRQYPHTNEIVYFNCAANSPFSFGIEAALNAYVQRRMREGGDGHDELRRTATELKQLFADMTNCAPDEVGLESQTTYGLNLAAYGLPLKSGDEVLLSDREFPAAVYTWQTAAEIRGFSVNYLPSVENRFDLEQFRKAIGPHTRALCLSWIHFHNGYKNDLAEIGKICRERGLYFVVDGIQGMGVEPIDFSALEIDIFTAGAQKWLLASQGSGFFYIRKAVQAKMIQPLASWMDVDWEGNYTDLFHYDKPIINTARRFEMAYYNVLNLVSNLPPMKLIAELGLANIQKHNYGLIDRLADYVKQSDTYRVTSTLVPKHRSSIFTFTCDNVIGLQEELTKNRIVVARREGSIRASIHCYNDESDIDKLIAVLKQFAGRN